MNRFLTLKPWTVPEAVACVIALAVLVAIAPATGVLSPSGAFAGGLGGLLLRHMALHGWTLVRGTLAQRLALLGVWLVAAVLGGFLATAIGF